MLSYILSRGLPPDYRCELRNLTSEEWWGEGKKEVAIGIFCLSYGIVVIPLYCVCCYVLLQKDLIKYTAYKFLFYLSCIDIIGLIPNSILSGIFFLQGAVYCNYPNFIYFWGCVCLGYISLILPSSLIVEIRVPTANSFITFPQIRALWMRFASLSLPRKPLVLSFLVVFAYQGYFFFFAKPIFFNSVARTWLFDPLIFPDGRMIDAYQCFFLTFNNSAVVFFGFLLYIAFIFVFIYKYYTNVSINKNSFQMFIQSAYVCLCNLILGVLYLVLQFVHVPEFVSFVGLIMWQLSSSGNLFLFLFINKTVQKRVIQILGLKRSKIEPNSATLEFTMN